MRGARVKREDGDTASDGGDDEVFVQRVAFPEDGDVQEHDGEEFAALGEDVGDVVDVCEGGVAEGGGEGICEGHEEEGREDLFVGDHGGDRLAARGAEAVEEQASDACEEGLDGEEEDGEFEALAGGAVSSRRELLLEVGPCKACGEAQC
jgi:hypothetical protein